MVDGGVVNACMNCFVSDVVCDDMSDVVCGGVSDVVCDDVINVVCGGVSDGVSMVCVVVNVD